MLEDWRGFHTRLCNFVRKISTNISALGQRTHLKLEELPSLFIVYNITIFWLYPLHSFWFIFYCEKWTDQHNTSAEQSESPTGIEPMTSRTPGGRSIYWAMRTHAEQRHFTELMCDRCPAYCWDQYCRSHRECSKWIKMLNVIGNS